MKKIKEGKFIMKVQEQEKIIKNNMEKEKELYRRYEEGKWRKV